MGEQRFATGHITKTALLADAGALISDWTADGGLWWMVASGNVVTPYAVRIGGLGGQTAHQGQTVVSPWTFNVLSGAMFNYLATTVFGGLASIDATILTFNQQKQAYEAYQCIATLSEISEQTLQPWGNYGFRDARIDFSQCVLNTD